MTTTTRYKIIFVTILLAFLVPFVSNAATLSVSPSTGVYSAGTTFSVRVVVNTQGKSINAAEGTLKFNPQEVSVVSVDRSSSIFNLWVTEPTFSNSAGTINFSGGMPTGYTGSAGTIFNVTFRSSSANTARVSLTTGSVLANDGQGTNILTSMSGGTYTIQAPSSNPVPEVIEYVAPANTPAAPVISSATHPDPTAWYQSTEAILKWSLPAGITGVRTLLDENANTIPTKVYENPITEITLSDLEEGESYFHLQFRNEDGWGKVTHYRLAVDTEKPESLVISQAEDNDFSNPEQTLSVDVIDKTSAVNKYKIKINNDEAFDYIDEENTRSIVLPKLDPGYYVILIEAFDEAGNSIVSSYSFTVNAFTKPVFTDYPSELNEGVIPVIKGTTKPNSIVTVYLELLGTEPVIYSTEADETGVFTFIPASSFVKGVYELKAVAEDESGAKSEYSETIRIAVQEPGYIRIGSLIVSALSVLVPLIALIILLVIGVIFMLTYFRRFRKSLSKESTETLVVLNQEFASLEKLIDQKEKALAEAKKSKKLTKKETEVFVDLKQTIKNSLDKIRKEAKDVSELSNSNNE